MKYVTKQGDTWDGIAWSELGDVRYTPLLMRANEGVLETQYFRAGVELELPTIESASKTTKAPWEE